MPITVALSIDSAGARRMLAAADQAGVQLSMASKFRYVDDVILAKSIVTSGILGDIILFENAFTAHVDSQFQLEPASAGRQEK